MASDAWQSVARWWDGVELWLTQLGLPAQIVILRAVLLPTCWWVATGIDRGVDLISERIGRREPGDGGG